MARAVRSACFGLALVVVNGQTVTPPGDQGGSPVVLAFSGTQSADLYGPLLQAIQAKASAMGLSVWTVAADSMQDTDAGVEQVKAGQPQARVFYGGHGMRGGGGAAAAQAYAAQKGDASGVVLLAGFLQRTWRPSVADCQSKWSVQPTHDCPSGVGLPLCPGGYLPEGVHDCPSSGVPTPNYPAPTLAVGGDLDGVVRVGRLAEAWYTQKSVPQHQVAVVEGMNHGDLLAQVPGDVAAVDLQSELGGDGAKDQVAGLVAGFLASPGQSQVPSLDGFFAPFEQMFVEQEGSWWFTGNSDERGSSAWAADAQRRMVEPVPDGFSGWQTSNEFHLLSDEESIPPYYRSKHRPDVQLGGDGHSLVGSTVTQLRYVELSVLDTSAGLNGWEIIKEETTGVLSSDKFSDDGTNYVSALEIATKLASRQLAFSRTGQDAPDSLDDGDRCKDINQAAYDLALSVASDKARQRFQARGRPLVMVADQKPFPPAGPWWIWNYLKYDDKGQAGVEVSSLYAFYSLSGPAYGAGNHYCKLLSPARALEWIYTDSLRAPSAAAAAQVIV